MGSLLSFVQIASWGLWLRGELGPAEEASESEVRKRKDSASCSLPLFSSYSILISLPFPLNVSFCVFWDCFRRTTTTSRLWCLSATS